MMRLACLDMVLLLLGALLGTARCQLQTPFNWMADGIDILRPFPAGLPVPTHPFNVTSFKAPPLPANAYRSVYGYTTCVTDELISPRSTEELAAAVKRAAATAAAQARRLKIRAARQGCASSQSFTCAVQPSYTPLTVNGTASYAVGLMLDGMNKLLSVDAAKRQLRVQAQMTVRQLLQAANANSLSVPRAALPWWQNLTLAGVYATGAHGTGLNTTSTLCDWVVSTTWVDSAGNVHVSAKGSAEATALCGGLGLLGTLAEFTLQLTEPTHTQFSTWHLRSDANLAADVDAMLKTTPHVVVLWRPDVGKYTAHLQKQAAPGSAPLPGASCNVIPKVSSFVGYLTGGALQAWQADPFNRGSFYFTAGGDASVCLIGEALGLGASWVTVDGPGGVPLRVFDGVARTNAITSTECNETCAFIAPSLMATGVDVEFAFDKARLPEFIADIKALIARDLRGIPGFYAHTRCIPPGYFVLRFGRAPDSLLAHGAGVQQPVYVQQQMLASRATPGTPSRYEWIFETYEQLMLCKYRARPHTGKNWERTFSNPRCPVPYGAALAKMTAMQDKHDAARVFEPALWHRVAAGKGYQLKPRCALDRSCYCEADEHCAAGGFKCLPSIAFPAYKACRPAAMN